MEDSKKQAELREAVIKWLNSAKRDFTQGAELMSKTGYKPHVLKRIQEWGSSDPRAARAVNIELRNWLRDARKNLKPETTDHTPTSENVLVTNIEKELQKEYPAEIKRILEEYHSLYQTRSILHKELKAVGEANDDQSNHQRKRKLTAIDAISHRMDTLWGIFDQYKTDDSLPLAEFFEQPFDPEKETNNTDENAENNELVLPDSLDELKKLKENLRIKISKAENRLEYQSEKKEEKPNPMPESPKRAELLKKIEEMAYRCFTPTLIAINLELDETEFVGQAAIEGSVERKAYYKGLISQQMELRDALIKAAHNGSNPAQEQLLKIMEQLKGLI